ncbi:MAG: bifunctional adenosylcobinamide kinase/adenosylcobinamide-phosphate guanylyltransferase [Actinomycetota bacterium]|nr:bifunctional adenosylcobinamide kinase/adenosylcobinamide-phosphate guanylyltransferase [Actinomycetota bacterium]
MLRRLALANFDHSRGGALPGGVVALPLITLVLGGVASGKSAYAESLVPPEAATVTYFATLDPSSEGVASRIAQHRRRRPAYWSTAECGLELPRILESRGGLALVDSLGAWVARFPDCLVEERPLLEALSRRVDPVILVSEEVGMSPLPATAIGVAFQDAMGRVNRAVAAVADQVFLVVAGRVLQL